MAETKLRKPAPRAAPAAAVAPSPGDNRPSPIRTLRDWLDHLAARDRLAVIKPRVGEEAVDVGRAIVGGDWRNAVAE